MSRAVRAGALALWALALGACTHHATNIVLDLDCGAVKLRFREDITADFNITRFEERLLVG
jgi:hypothetical protein